MLALLSMTAFCAMAQSSIRLVAYGFPVGGISGWDNGVGWIGWRDCRVPISINSGGMGIRISSKDNQDYQIVEDPGEVYGDNGKADAMKCMDQDGLMCKIRVREQDGTGSIQLYVGYVDYIRACNVRQYWQCSPFPRWDCGYGI